MKKISLFFALLITMLLSAQNPTINVQGVLRDAEGNAVADGEKSMIFTFYNEAINGTALDWEESQAVVVINGVYNVQLGAQTPLNLPFDQTYFLEIQVDGETMEPRLALSMAPYSLSVRGLDNVFPNSGNVGIGTANPQAKLQVEGNTVLNGNVSTSGNTEIAGTLNVNNSTTLNGHLGVGTSNPSTTMQVATGTDAAATGGGYVQIGTTDNILIDNNEIMARSDNQGSTLYINKDGGAVHLGNSSGKTRVNGGMDVYGSVKMMGNRQVWHKNNFNWGWNYAATDGVVTAYIGENEGYYVGIKGWVNSSSTDNGAALMTVNKDQDDDDNGQKDVGICFPVRKGEYWKVQWYGGNHPNLDSGYIMFTPFGN